MYGLRFLESGAKDSVELVFPGERDSAGMAPGTPVFLADELLNWPIRCARRFPCASQVAQSANRHKSHQ
jgi:hypothetical protein